MKEKDLIQKEISLLDEASFLSEESIEEIQMATILGGNGGAKDSVCPSKGKCSCNKSCPIVISPKFWFSCNGGGTSKDSVCGGGSSKDSTCPLPLPDI